MFKARIVLFVLVLLVFSSCKEQAPRIFKKKVEPEKTGTGEDIERFGFMESATPTAVPKVIVPFDNERTRQTVNEGSVMDE
jgi:hypothetical protein